MNAKKYVASKVVDIDMTTCKTLNHTKERKSFLQTEKKYMLHEIKQSRNTSYKPSLRAIL